MSSSPPLAESLAAAARAIGGVLSGASLNVGLEAIKPRQLRAAAQDLAFNALRGYGFYDGVIDRLLERPLSEMIVKGLIMAALAELTKRPHAAHMVVHQAVEATVAVGQPRSRGLINAVLRNYLRREQALCIDIQQTEVGRLHYPQWWIDRVRATYPANWEAILLAGNERPPMVLRVNCRRSSVTDYLARLSAAGMGGRAIGGAAIALERPCRMDALPGFREGDVSVQDRGAQAAAHLLDVAPGMRVLDACSAPGGKAAHLLELTECSLLAVDISKQRTARITENLSRLGLRAEVLSADASNPESFWDGRPYDRILADVPCTASGVVRRHPDIRWLRREADISGFSRQQERLLEALWRMLSPGGTLLYATCSVFPEENTLQVASFLDRHPDADSMPIVEPAGGQFLPASDTDGFYYALLKKAKS